MFARIARTIVLAFTIAVAVGALVSPAANAATCPTPAPAGITACGTAVYATANPTFVGWAHAENANGLAGTVGVDYYSGSTWHSFSLDTGSWVYVESYTQASGWDWAYSWSYRFWFIMPTSSIVTSITPSTTYFTNGEKLAVQDVGSPLRSAPNNSASVIATMPKTTSLNAGGGFVTLYGNHASSDAWCEVNYNGRWGYTGCWRLGVLV